MINLIKAELYKETTGKRFKVLTMSIIIVSILYILLISKNLNTDKKYEELNPILDKASYLKINKSGQYTRYEQDYPLYKDKIVNKNTLININNNSKLKELLINSSVLFYILGIVIIFKSYHSISYDLTNKTIRYVFQTNKSKKSILLSKILTLMLITIMLYTLLYIIIITTSYLITKENIFKINEIIYFNNKYIKIPYLIYYLSYIKFIIPIFFMIIFTLFITTLLNGKTLSLIISCLLYLFSLTISMVLIGEGFHIMEYTFMPYLDLSYFENINTYYLNNIIYNSALNINKGFIILLIYSIILLLLNMLLLKRDQ